MRYKKRLADYGVCVCQEGSAGHSQGRLHYLALSRVARTRDRRHLGVDETPLRDAVKKGRQRRRHEVPDGAKKGNVHETGRVYK